MAHLELAAAQEEIRALINEVRDALNTGDTVKLRSLLSERAGAVHVGTDADEWWTSTQVVDAIAQAGDRSDQVGGSDIQVHFGEPQIHVHGDIAWAESRGGFSNEHGDERAMRTTSVLMREDGHWRVVQSHTSLGVPNADIFG